MKSILHLLSAILAAFLLAGCAAPKQSAIANRQSAMVEIPAALIPPGVAATPSSRAERTTSDVAVAATIVAPPFTPELEFVVTNEFLSLGYAGWPDTVKLRVGDRKWCEKVEGCFSGTNGIHAVVWNAILLRRKPGTYYGPTAMEHPEYFTYENCHPHVHAKNVSRATVRNARTREIVSEGAKLGWCVLPKARVFGTNPPVAGTCTAWAMAQGWIDEYGDLTQCQGVDMTGKPDGDYELELVIDEDNLYGLQQTNSLLFHLTQTNLTRIIQPTLAIVRDGENIRVTWTGGPEWVLQTSLDLANWSTPEGFGGAHPAAAVPSLNQYTEPATAAQKFFRLALAS